MKTLRAAAADDLPSQYNLALCYDQGLGTEIDPLKADSMFRNVVNACLTRAEQGDAVAQYVLGLCYLNGKGLKQKKELGFHWLSQAADQAYDRAQYMAAICHLDGIGTDVDINASLRLFKRAARQGHPEALSTLEAIYTTGTYVPQNSARAKYWLKKTADHGDASAQYLVGRFYAGKPGDISRARSVKYFALAAAQDNIDAQIVLLSPHVEDEFRRSAKVSLVNVILHPEFNLEKLSAVMGPYFDAMMVTSGWVNSPLLSGEIPKRVSLTNIHNPPRAGLGD